MVPIVARALILLAISICLLAVALLIHWVRPAGARPGFSLILVVAALLLGLFALLMVLLAGP
jgi:hypothetical protein